MSAWSVGCAPGLSAREFTVSVATVRTGVPLDLAKLEVLLAAGSCGAGEAVEQVTVEAVSQLVTGVSMQVRSPRSSRVPPGDPR